MPESYSSVGEATAAAMAHNTPLAHHETTRLPEPHTDNFTELDAHINRADHYGTDVALFHWEEQSIWADTRVGIDDRAHRLLESFGFIPVSFPGILTSHELLANLPWPAQQAHAATAARTLISAGFTVALDPDLHADADLPDAVARYRASRPDATTLTSPAAPRHVPSHAQPFVPPVPPTAASANRRTR